jgi:hypothetical protein
VSSFSRRTILALPALPLRFAGSERRGFSGLPGIPAATPARRRRLLERERERTSVRWQQFETLVAGKVQMPEPGFAWALYGQIAKSEAFSRQAAGWALQASDPADRAGVRLVPDGAPEPEAAALRTKLETLLAAPPRARTLPVIRGPGFCRRGAWRPKQANGSWRRSSRAGGALSARPGAQGRHLPLQPRGGQALFELHAVRDSINIDLRGAPRSTSKSCQPSTF